MDIQQTDMDWHKYTDDGHKQLACAILYEAIDDWEKYGTIDRERAGTILARWRFNTAQRRCILADELGFDSPREEMLAFFQGDWFRILCGMADVPAKAMLKKLALS